MFWRFAWSEPLRCEQIMAQWIPVGYFENIQAIIDLPLRLLLEQII